MITRLLLVAGTVLGLSSSVQAQSTLTFNNLMTIVNSDVGQIQNLLQKRGWVFTGESDDQRSTPSCDSPEIAWSYGPHPGSTGEAILEVFKDDNCQNGIDYFTYSATTFQAIKAQVKAWGGKSAGTTVRKSMSGQSTGIVEKYDVGIFWVKLITISPPKGYTKQAYSIMIERKR